MQFAEVADGAICPPLVVGSFEAPMAGECFEAGAYMVGRYFAIAATLETSYYGTAQYATEIGIFPKGFAGTAPAGIAAYIHNRGQYHIRAFGTGFPGYIVVYFFNEQRIPGAGKA